jgi:hypothetical protein
MIIKGQLPEVRRLIREWFAANPDKAVLEASSCATNAYGWSLEGHNAMRQLAEEGMPGFRITYRQRHGVADWHVTNEERRGEREEA